METTGIVTIGLILVNIVVTYRGLRDPAFFHEFSFDLPRLRVHKDYRRFITSGFLHSGWMHLIFNMAALYGFGRTLEVSLGPLKFIAIYFLSLICGNLLAMFVHRHKSMYTAVGASGAVSGVVFGFIALFPDRHIGLLLIPLDLPGWIFGLLYILYCMFGIRAQRDNIGHDAHLAGGITGLILTVAMSPVALFNNYFPVLLLLVPSLVFLFIVIRRPEFLLLERPFSKDEGVYTLEDRYNSSRRMKELELDRLLDKINTNGIESLSKKERERLEQLSKVK